MSQREALHQIWGRRVASFSLYGLLGTLAFALSPLLLVAAGLYDALRGGRPWPRVRALLFFLLYLGCEAWGLLGAGALWLFTLGGLLVGPRRTLDLNAALQRAWSSALFWGSVRTFSMKVQVEGLDLAARGPMLMMVRHSSTADTLLAAALVANPNRLLLRYVLKQELLWDPCLDVVGRRLPNAFIDRAARKRGEELALIAELAQGLDQASAVLIYPEGTRFSESKRSLALDKLRDQPRLHEIAAGMRAVLPPRLAGPLSLLQSSPGTDVVILEHQGLEGGASFKEFWDGGLVGTTITVRLRRISAADIPAEGRDIWLFEQWAETDRWVQAQTAAQPSAPSTPEPQNP